ncbi:MAG: DUF4292 domain-containing protein [Flammeovirgaceae bacterium]|nr:DUF4292 domain-containing protein [Flammeovirgaceae bacterium]
MTRVNIILIMVLTGLVLVGCNRKLTGFNSDGIEINELAFDYLTAKAKINYGDGKKNLSVTANYRIKKDSIIWISVSPGLGVEVARLMLLSDSIFFMDRINNKYIGSSFSEFSALYGFDITYQTVQSAILGDAIFKYKKTAVNKVDGGMVYQQLEENYILDNFIGDETKKVERVLVKDLKSKKSISVNYGDFRKLDERSLLPYSIQFTLVFFQGDEQKQIDIEVKSANLLDKAPKFPFNVPDKFKVN